MTATPAPQLDPAFVTRVMAEFHKQRRRVASAPQKLNPTFVSKVMAQFHKEQKRKLLKLKPVAAKNAPLAKRTKVASKPKAVVKAPYRIAKTKPRSAKSSANVNAKAKVRGVRTATSRKRFAHAKKGSFKKPRSASKAEPVEATLPTVVPVLDMPPAIPSVASVASALPTPIADASVVEPIMAQMAAVAPAAPMDDTFAIYGGNQELDFGMST